MPTLPVPMKDTDDDLDAAPDVGIGPNGVPAMYLDPAMAGDGGMTQVGNPYFEIHSNQGTSGVRRASTGGNVWGNNPDNADHD